MRYLPHSDIERAEMLATIGVVSIDALFAAVRTQWDGLDGLVHSIAYSPTEALEGDFLNGISREAFRIAHDVSAYSFPALAKGARPLLQGRNGSLLAMSYLGADEAVPHYGLMGPVKAALQSLVRYMALELGPDNVRVHAVSPGPIMTRAASGIEGFDELMNHAIEKAPLGRLVRLEEIAHLCAFLCSDAASGMTGQTLYVDAGCHAVA